ncbi:cilia- and flagella-associated protein 107-like [Onthophagus taurus]|uniref:cilia- and flagella-associated protein 107-like n=1 Tax=Onthophagus taurus TaxID=166361 RepID=UPI000C208F55|nr:uncharacterized protein C1orf158 homolog [Onthophagus taurus]
MCSKSKSSERFQLEKYSPPFSNKTLIGKWVEERSRYKKARYRHYTTYNRDYTPQPPSKIDIDNTDKKNGIGPRLLIDINGDQFTKNFSTTYDLSYNHYPKLKRICNLERNWKVLQNKWVPEDDYTINFGSVTEYGLKAYKERLWEEQKSGKVCNITTYADHYLPPDDEARRFKRWGIPVKNSSLMHQSNLDTLLLKLRDQPSFYVTPNEELVIVPREKRCNPITWECFGNPPKESKHLSQ